MFDFDPSNWIQDSYGQFPPIDVDRLARENGLTLTPNFVIRFQQQGERELAVPESSDFFSDGIFLDDVVVRAAPETYHGDLPFQEGFENQDQLAGPFHWGDPRLSLPPGVLDPGGLVDILPDGIPHKGISSVALGRRVNGKETTNALDLLLDLSNYTNVKLVFWIYANGDEFEPKGDGIWFSDDGGANFRSVYPFDNLSQREYQKRTLDVDTLATNIGLSLTDRFVIRFEQHGERDFSGTSDFFGDGIYLDDIKVKGTPLPGDCNGLPVTLIGTNGDDFLQGTPGNDVIAGHGGRDIISGLDGDDVICGGEGDDVVDGGEGNDVILGGSGSDVLLGKQGDDQLIGGEGRDYLIGGGGTNNLSDAAANDKVF